MPSLKAATTFGQIPGMYTEMDKQFQLLDPQTTASVEPLVRDALALISKDEACANSWPPQFWQRIRDLWRPNPFDRPPQGVISTPGGL